MDILAENRFSITKSLFFEGMSRISRDGYGKAARKSMLVFLALWVAFAVFTLCSGGELVQTLWYLLLVVLIGLWICVLMPRSHAKRAWRKLENRCGTDLERHTLFYPDHLEIRSAELEKQIPYEEIDHIRHSRRLMILVCRDKTGVLLARGGFSGKTPDEVQALIESAKNKE